MKKLLLVIFSFTTLLCQGQTSVRSMPDTFTVLQASVDTFDLVQNDTVPLGDSVCISLLDSHSRFTIIDCRHIAYRADSFATGKDTIRYALCDTALKCDTTMLSIHIYPDPSLLPFVSFTVDTSIPDISWFMGNYRLFDSVDHLYIPECFTYVMSSHSRNADSVRWQIMPLTPASGPCCCFFPTITYDKDTISFNPGRNYCSMGRVVLILTGYNRFGSTAITDTSSSISICEGITEIPLSGISLYPSPADRIINIDMQQNTDDISTHYSHITITNSLGQKVRTIMHSSSKLITVPVSDLPAGVYIASITAESGSTRVLGRFAVKR